MSIDITLLKDLCDNFKKDIVDGPFGSNLKREHFVDEGIPVLKIQNIKPFLLIPKNLNYVTPEKYEELKRHSYKQGDIVMTKLGNPLGASAIVTNIENGLIVADTVRIRAEKIDTKYLCYHLNSPITQDLINSQQKGATRPRVKIANVRELPIYAPKKEKQKQIVEILDKAFEVIDKAKENIEKNIQNSKELFQSRLNEIFSQKGEGWEEKTLKEVCSIITDGTHQTPKYFDSGYTFLSSKNVTSGVIDWDNIKYIDKEQHIQMQKRVSPQLNDVLLAKNGTTGVAAIVDREVDFDIYVSLALLRATEKLKPRYLLHFVNSSTAKAQFNKRLKGVGVPNLHLKEIREVIINYPIDKNEQKKIVEYIDDLTYIRNGLVDNYQQKLKNIEELKKSILQKAFSGELI
ncbi:restriction endonuclease subunit S [Halarcobacter sp.]|uniref:restriction endonuclease subunit S n=1 Tax=Halarcobacter sp. TaxID=2321133 RepID=UPI003A8CE4B1